MNSVSKELKNVLKISGKREELNEFIKRLSKNCNTLEVKLPDYDIRKMSEDYIDQNWSVVSDTNDIVFYARKNNALVLAFSNDEYEGKVLNLIEELKLNASYRYLMEDILYGVIIKERFSSGKADFDFERESSRFKLSQYSVAKCF